MQARSQGTGKTVPACPECGTRESVIRMASSLTPFEKPDMNEDFGGRYYCQKCAHDFAPDLPEEAEEPANWKPEDWKV